MSSCVVCVFLLNRCEKIINPTNIRENEMYENFAPQDWSVMLQK